MAMGGEVAVDMRNLLADERTVMTERVDHFILGGKITAGRDYFGLSQFSALFDAAT